MEFWCVLCLFVNPCLWLSLTAIPVVDKSRKNCLAVATFSSYQATLWAAVPPRLCFTGFSFAQPFLIHTLIDAVGSSGREISRGELGGLIGATALVYLGIAVRPKSNV